MSTLVKICGVTRSDQAMQIAALGADFIGVNFWPKSKRFVARKESGWLAAALGATEEKTKIVGLFVNPDESEVIRVFTMLNITQIQLHGDESPDFCATLQARGLRIIKAFQVRDEASLDRIADYPVDDILLDAYSTDDRGGSGKTFSWELALRFKEKLPGKRLWLAGGLTPENVAEAVRVVRPYAVDVASGVEDDVPGVKNLDKVTQFIERAKAAAASV